jgi:hypothetical protein
LDCLGPSRFTAKIPALEPWICLDFLGFSRAKRDLSMGYAGKTAKKFPIGFPLLEHLEQADRTVVTR